MSTLDKFVKRAQGPPFADAPSSGDPIWVVRDSDRLDEMVFGPYDANGLARLIIGTGLDVWMQENTVVYADAVKARGDAEARLRRAT